jgi:diguanylate cyclase (GGDEF)-like protein
LGAGLIFLDCDNFKYINDSYGHSVGDAVLQQIGRQLRHIVRDANTVARLGGDEFVILLSDLQDAVTDTAAVAQQIIDTLKQPVPVGELELFVTASVGISLYPSDAATAEDLLKHADTALYRAKEMGRHRYQFYSSEMSDRAVARASLESALRRAIEQQQFALHYQPQIEIATGRVIGVEALIRWECPRQGLIPPARFIAVAEETGMILPIGEWVLESACRQARAWLDAGLEPMTVSVNLSALQLRQADFFTRVSNILDRTGLHPGQLDLEITESMLVSKTESLQALLHQLKDLGVMLSLDDFGTGYSNLGYLQSFPLTRIKIDRSFIKGIPGHLDNVAIATAIVNLGHGLGLQVLAEGVETAGEAQFLADIGCEYAQGYWYGKPMPATEFETWLAQTGSYSWVA